LRRPPVLRLAPAAGAGNVRDMTELARLTGRGVLEIAGADRVPFLQGLVSGDVAAAAPGRAVWSALLTPQGKWLADFFVLAEAERLLLDCEAEHLRTITDRLSRFRLRAAVAFADRSADLPVHAAWNGEPDLPENVVAATDPRLPEAGWRILSPVQLCEGGEDAWDLHRLALGLPDGSRDLEGGKSVLLEAGFDELGGVSWSKGCYMGQELTARTRYRGLLKRRLIPVAFSGAPPVPGTPVLDARGIEVGTMRSSRETLGLALLRLDALHHEGGQAPRLTCGAAVLATRILPWMRLPAEAA
jgi:folate-binding protein YgfZ